MIEVQNLQKSYGDLLALSKDSQVLAIRNGAEKLAEVLHCLSGCGAVIRSTRLTEPNLESLLLKLTGVMCAVLTKLYSDGRL